MTGFLSEWGWRAWFLLCAVWWLVIVGVFMMWVNDRAKRRRKRRYPTY